VKRKEKVKTGNNLIQAIKKAGYNPNLWKEEEISHHKTIKLTKK